MRRIRIEKAVIIFVSLILQCIQLNNFSKYNYNRHFNDHDSKNRSLRKSYKENVLKSARNERGGSDTEGSNKKMRKSAKGHHSKERYTEQGSHSDDLKEIKAILNAKVRVYEESSYIKS